jgi:hypothetical protein
MNIDVQADARNEKAGWWKTCRRLSDLVDRQALDRQFAGDEFLNVNDQTTADRKATAGRRLFHCFVASQSSA